MLSEGVKHITIDFQKPIPLTTKKSKKLWHFQPHNMRATGQSESEKRSGKNIYNKIKPLQKMSETQKADRICWEKQVCSRKNLKTNSILQGIT